MSIIGVSFWSSIIASNIRFRLSCIVSCGCGVNGFCGTGRSLDGACDSVTVGFKYCLSHSNVPATMLSASSGDTFMYVFIIAYRLFACLFSLPLRFDTSHCFTCVCSIDTMPLIMLSGKTLYVSVSIIGMRVKHASIMHSLSASADTSCVKRLVYTSVNHALVQNVIIPYSLAKSPRFPKNVMGIKRAVSGGLTPCADTPLPHFPCSIPVRIASKVYRLSLVSKFHLSNSSNVIPLRRNTSPKIPCLASKINRASVGGSAMYRQLNSVSFLIAQCVLAVSGRVNCAMCMGLPSNPLNHVTMRGMNSRFNSGVGLYPKPVSMSSNGVSCVFSRISLATSVSIFPRSGVTSVATRACCSLKNVMKT